MIDKKFIYNFLRLGSVSGLAVIVQLLYLGILARQLDQTEFGFQVLVQVGLLFSVMVCERGMAAALLVGKVGAGEEGTRVFRLPTIFFGCCVSVLYLFYLLILSFYHPTAGVSEFYWLLLLTPLIASIAGFFRVNAQLEDDFQKIALMEVCGHVSFLLAIFLFWSSSNINFIYFGWFVQHVVMLLYISKGKLLWFFSELRFLGFERHSLNYILERSFSGATPILDRPFVSGTYTLSDVAIFDNLLKLTLYPSGRIIPIVAKIIEPRIKVIDFNNSAVVNSSYRIYSWLLLPFLVPYFYMIGFRSQEVTDTLLGQGWFGVSDNLLMYSVFGMVSIITSLGSIFLFASGHSSSLKKFAMATVLINVVCLIMMVVLGITFGSFLVLYVSCQLILLFCFAVLLKLLINIKFMEIAITTATICTICILVGQFGLQKVNIFSVFLLQAILVGVIVVALIKRELTLSDGSNGLYKPLDG